MRDGWRVLRLGEIAETCLGKTLPRGAGADVDGYPYLRNVNVQWGRVDLSGLNRMPFSSSERAALTIRAGDILVCEGGEVGRLAYITEDLPGIGFQNALHRVRVDRQVAEPRFVALALEHFVRSGGLEGLTTRVTIAHLNQAKLRALVLALPPLAEQRRIVDLIGALDDTIERHRELEGQQLDLRSKLLDAAFGGEPSLTVGELVAGIDAGRSPAGENRPPGPGERGVLKVSAVRPTGFVPTESKVVADTEWFAERHRVRSGDVLITRANTAELVGAVCLVEEGHPNLYLCDKTLRLVPTHGVDPGALVAALNAPASRAQLSGAATGTSASMKNISQANIRDVRVAWPASPDDQTAIGQVDRAVLSEVRALNEATARIENLRSRLLTALLSGEHVIPESYDELMEAV